MLREKIAANLEEAFSKYGFAQPSVAQLKSACNVSLRTLYKHYPSKEAMIIAALEYRHKKYIAFLLSESHSTGIDSVLHIFEKLNQWMAEFAPNGCLSLNAIAAFPEDIGMKETVRRHKEEVHDLLKQLSQREDLSTELFLLHESVSSVWPIMGKASVTSAQKIIKQLWSAQSHV
ncbi:TetR/AcrR family transcriptional regulator [Cognaticolwellia beringensis]|uniref:TetR/AcrR family transcriptional regulator n=1 Tax=Cognaticolwellia beringensis TaxID=1967665 RepID=A0A222GDS6_9GAMM|nr:TetR/AcrR family transcriptional regulator [Cognaticolwellia beringensis]ASP50035.1 TetR/AcrR family transcriptional regulator [Cognaticolwellia beringensis]